MKVEFSGDLQAGHWQAITEYLEDFENTGSGSIEKIKIHAKDTNKQGLRRNYSLQAQADTSAGFYRASSTGWDFHKTAHKMIDKLDKQMRKSEKKNFREKAKRIMKRFKR